MAATRRSDGTWRAPGACPRPPAGQAGFNLIELLISMSLATIVFMAVVALFVRESAVMTSQNERIDLDREARFSLDHLRRDLSAIGSNSTPNSEVDPLVCPKPSPALRALTLTTGDGYVSDPSLNPFVKPLSITLFGSLDIKSRYRTASIAGDTITLFDDGKLPVGQPAWDAIFSVDRYLRISGPDGTMMFYPILSCDAGDLTIKLASSPPQVTSGQPCGYQSFGQNYAIDVQGFVRYRIVADSRPGATVGPNGAVERGLLVRERLETDATTVHSQLILAENAVDLDIYDMMFDTNPVSDLFVAKMFHFSSDVLDNSGGGVLGADADATPERLRFLTVKISIRGEWPDAKLVHRPRVYFFRPLQTWLLADDGRGASQVFTVATRVSLPTMVSRNL